MKSQRALVACLVFDDHQIGAASEMVEEHMLSLRAPVHTTMTLDQTSARERRESVFLESQEVDGAVVNSEIGIRDLAFHQFGEAQRSEDSKERAATVVPIDAHGVAAAETVRLNTSGQIATREQQLKTKRTDRRVKALTRVERVFPLCSQVAQAGFYLFANAPFYGGLVTGSDTLEFRLERFEILIEPMRDEPL